MRRSNIVISVALLTLAANHANGNTRRYVSPAETVGDTVINIPQVSQQAKSLVVECRARLKDSRPTLGLSNRSWGVTLPTDVSVAVTRWNETLDDIDGNQGFRITVSRGDTLLAQSDATDYVSLRGFNTLVLSATDDGLLQIDFGDAVPRRVLSTNIGVSDFAGVPSLWSTGAMSLSGAVVETVDDAFKCKVADVDSLMARISQSTDPMEGIWRSLDHDTDDSRARPGGRYTLITTSLGDGSYNITYLNGAVTNAMSWQPGMLKGRLTPTIFSGHYDLEWLDAMSESMGLDCSCTIEQGVIMTMNFPVYRSRLRFSLMPKTSVDM